METKAKCLYARGVTYSPSELLEAVEHATEMGEEFLKALWMVHCRMKRKDPTASVTDLIRKSITPSGQAARAATTQVKRASHN